MSEWKPIDTAPKDRTLVDLWIEADGARFRATDYRWNGLTWEHKHGGTIENNFANVGMKPTYWMRVPLPPLPRSP